MKRTIPGRAVVELTTTRPRTVRRQKRPWPGLTWKTFLKKGLLAESITLCAVRHCPSLARVTSTRPSSSHRLSKLVAILLRKLFHFRHIWLDMSRGIVQQARRGTARLGTLVLCRGRRYRTVMSRGKHEPCLLTRRRGRRARQWHGSRARHAQTSSAAELGEEERLFGSFRLHCRALTALLRSAPLGCTFCTLYRTFCPWNENGCHARRERTKMEIEKKRGRCDRKDQTLHA